jgi:hypothetical protein
MTVLQNIKEFLRPLKPQRKEELGLWKANGAKSIFCKGHRGWETNRMRR